MSPAHDDELSMRERQIMDAVYRLGDATVAEVTEAIPAPPSSTAVRTMLGNLRQKGLLKRGKRGRAAVYSPRTRRDTAARAALRRVLDVFFAGSIASAVASHLADPRRRLSDEEVAELQRLIDEARSRSVR